MEPFSHRLSRGDDRDEVRRDEQWERGQRLGRLSAWLCGALVVVIGALTMFVLVLVKHKPNSTRGNPAFSAETPVEPPQIEWDRGIEFDRLDDADWVLEELDRERAKVPLLDLKTHWRLLRVRWEMEEARRAMLNTRFVPSLPDFVPPLPDVAAPARNDAAEP
jgi:hypothetical protein